MEKNRRGKKKEKGPKKERSLKRGSVEEFFEGGVQILEKERQNLGGRELETKRPPGGRAC